MRLALLLLALLMFLLPVQASAQDPIAGASVGTPVATLPGAIWADFNNDGNVDGYVYNGRYFAGVPAGKVTAPPVVSAASSTSASGVDPRWGLLAEIVERDFSADYGLASVPSTARWEVPNQIIVWTDWTALGRQEKRFTFDATGRIAVRWKNLKGELEVTATGELLWVHGDNRSPFLSRTPEGGYRQRWDSSAKHFYRPLREGMSGSEKIAQMIAEGKTRAADPSLTTQLASGPVVSQPQSSPQTNVSTTVQSPQSQPSSVAPAIAAAAAASGPRYALVIGNSQYQASLGRLPNPVNDAQSVAAALRAVGFDVDLVVDADQKGMKRAISRFGERLSSARGATGLFYYAGHGIQSRGTNYLIPVSAPIEREADLDLEAVAADTVLAQMEDAGAATSIVILDACRNMPLARSFRSSSRGLARMDAPNGSFIAYSTAPGATAADGDGRNSPFAAALVKQIGQKGTPIEVVFRGIRREVAQATNGQQTPWDSSSLMDPFYFVP